MINDPSKHQPNADGGSSHRAELPGASLSKSGRVSAKRIARFAQGAAKRLGYALGGLFLIVSLSANKACREDYFFAVRTEIPDASPTPTGSPAGTPTATPTEDPDATETATATPTARGSRTPTPAVVGSATPTATPQMALPLSILTDLEDASERAAELTPTAAVPPAPLYGGGARAPDSNWLGNLYNDKDEKNANAGTGGYRAVLVGESDEYQRSVTGVLKGLGFDVLPATEEIELEDALENHIALAVLDASSVDLPPCQAASDIIEARGGKPIGMVVVGGTEGATFACGGRALGETVGQPVSRPSMMKAVERVLGRIRSQGVSASAALDEED